MGVEVTEYTVELPPPTLRTRIRRLLFGSVEWSVEVDGRVVARGTTRTRRGAVRRAALAVKVYLFARRGLRFHVADQ